MGANSLDIALSIDQSRLLISSGGDDQSVCIVEIDWTEVYNINLLIILFSNFR